MGSQACATVPGLWLSLHRQVELCLRDSSSKILSVSVKVFAEVIATLATAEGADWL